MARLVVLEFDDNEEADNFVEYVNSTSGAHSGGSVAALHADSASDDPATYPSAGIVGVFAMPTQFCPASGSGGCTTSKRVRAWTRGKKFGWWVCSVCKKPSGFEPAEIDRKREGGLFRRVISQGVNLLYVKPDVEVQLVEQTPATIHDEGWGVAGR